MVTAYLGFGANLGPVERTFAETLAALQSQDSCSSLRTSRLYLTEAWGPVHQPDFLNLVAEVNWTGELSELDRWMAGREELAGRRRSREVPSGPRPLDLDLLLYGDHRGTYGRLVLPHPRIHLRRFVLTPLVELAADLTPPGWEMTIAEALARCEDQCRVQPLNREVRFDDLPPRPFPVGSAGGI